MSLTAKKRRGQHLRIALVSVVGISLALTGCAAGGSPTSTTSGGADTSPIPLGVDAALTGPFAFAGAQEVAGMKLAAAYLNDNGGIDGRQVHLDILDDASSPDQAVLNLRKLAQQDKVAGIIGPVSSNSTVTGAQTADTLKIPLLAMPSTVGTIWEGSSVTKWGFGIAGSGEALGYGCMKAAIQAEKAKGNRIKSVAIGNETAVSMQTYVEGVKKYLRDNGIQIVSDTTWDGTSTDVTTQISQVLAAKADAVEFSALQTTNVLAIKALDQLGALGTTPIINCSSLDLASFQKALGDTLQADDYYTMFLLSDAYPTVKTGSPNDAERQRVYDAFQKYKSATGVETISNFSYAGWDTVMIYKEAIERNGGSLDAATLRDAMEKTHHIGAQSTVVFGPDQHRARYNDFAASAGVVVFGADGKLSLPTAK